MGSTGSRWTTGPLTSPHASGENPGQLALQEQGHVFRGEYEVAAAHEMAAASEEQVVVGFPSLFAAPCAAGTADQLWQLSPGVQPRDSVGTLIELAGSNGTAVMAADDNMCWRVEACKSTEGSPVIIGRGCTPLPPQYSNGSYECGGHNCDCNGGFAFHNDGTIRSLMERHCLELLSPGTDSAADATGGVMMGTCSGKAAQQFTAEAHSDVFAISQVVASGKVCITTSPGPPPPGPPPPPCSDITNQTACTARHCVWSGGACHSAPKPPPPPPKQVQPAVPEADWDEYFEIEDNYIHDMPIEYHSAISVFAGYIANSSISHNTMEHLSYDGIQFGWGWGQDTFAGRTTVANNSIDGVLAYSADGGNIYSQSPQHNSTISGNYAANDGNRYGMIYTDGASQIKLFDNVLNHGNAPCVFIHGGGHDPVGEHWYNDTHKPDLCCASIPEGVNVSTVMHELGPGEAWPAPAQAIIANAGRRTGGRN